MKSYEVYRLVEKLRNRRYGLHLFPQQPGYKPFRAALDALRGEYPISRDIWGVNSAYDCESLAEAGVPAEQIIAIVALCFPDDLNPER
jgi:hypothetical protein